MANFYSIQEAADYLQVDYKVVYRLVKEGRISSTRVGWQFRMTEEDLNTYLNGERVKQAVTAQAVRAANVAADAALVSVPASMPVSAPAPVQSGVDAALGVSKLRARQMEINFINRFSEKISSVATLRHPTSRQLLQVEDWAPLLQESDDREALMQALNTALLDRRTLATLPRNAVARYTVPGTPPLVIEARVLAHLAAFCRTGADDAPAALEDLIVEIDSFEEQHRKLRAAIVAGLASPTGWEASAVDYIVGVGRGDTYRNLAVRIVLVDLRTDTLYYDRFDEVTPGFAALFALATDAENIATIQDQLKAAVDSSRSRGVVLGELATALAVSQELALEAGRRLESAGGYRLISDDAQGFILVQT